MKNLFRRETAMAMALTLCAGCAHTVAIDASGTTKSGAIPPRVTYTVLPTTEVEKEPSFPQYAALVAGKMDEMGYKKTTDKTAQLGVFLAYASHESTAAAATNAANPAMGMGSQGPGGPSGSGYGAASGPSPNTPAQRMYTNQLVIVVMDLQKSSNAGPLVELWRGETMNTSSSKNFEQVAPLMVDAVFQHFGETTSNKVRHEFRIEDGKKPQEMK